MGWQASGGVLELRQCCRLSRQRSGRLLTDVATMRTGVVGGEAGKGSGGGE